MCNTKIILIALFIYIPVLVLHAEEPPQFKHTRYFEDFKIHDDFHSVFYSNLKQKVNAINPNTGGEVQYSFTLPNDVLERYSDDELDSLLYQAMISFSTQKGIMYFSHSRRKYRIFLEESYRIASLTDKSKIDDMRNINSSHIESPTEFYIYQEDSSFGKGVRMVTSFYDDKAHQFYVEIINKDPIKYQGIITTAKKEQFLLGLLINREGNRIDTYGVLATHAKTFAALRERISYSIIYRIFSIGTWFEGRVLELLAQQD